MDCQSALRARPVVEASPIQDCIVETPVIPSYSLGVQPLAKEGLAAFWLLFRRRKSNRGSGAARAPGCRLKKNFLVDNSALLLYTITDKFEKVCYFPWGQTGQEGAYLWTVF